MNPRRPSKRLVETLLTVCAAVALAACGGGGGGSASSPPTGGSPPPPANDAPVFALTFPLAGSVTDLAQLPLSGTPNDPDGDDIVSVTVSVNGASWPGTAQSDGSWRVPAVDLAEGLNELVIETEDAQGELGRLVAEVRRQLIFTVPAATAFDRAAGLLYVIDRGQRLLFSIDPATGLVALVASAQRGAGPLWTFPNAVQVDSGGNILVLDSGRVLSIDPATGDRTELIAAGFTLPPFAAMTIDPATDRLFLMTPGNSGLWRFDIGRDTAPSRVGAGGVTIAGTLLDATYAPAWNTVFAVDLQGAVYAYDVATGDVQLAFTLSAASAGLYNVEFDADAGELIALTGDGRLRRLDRSGTQLGVITPNGGVGTATVGLSVSGDAFFYVSQASAEVVAVSRTTQTLDVLASSRAGSGAIVTALSGGRLGEDGVLLYNLTSVVRFDPATGERTLAGRIPPQLGLVFGGLNGLPNGFAISRDETMAWVPSLAGEELLEVTLSSGGSRVASGGSVGSGAPFELITGVAVDAARETAYVTDAGRFDSRLVAVDLASGDRAELWRMDGATVRDVLLDESRETLLLDLDLGSSSGLFPFPLGPTDKRIVRVDLTGAGEATLQEIAADAGSGPFVLLPSRQGSLSVDGEAMLSLVDETLAGTIARTALDGGGTNELLAPLDAGGPVSTAPVAVVGAEAATAYVLDLNGAVFLVDLATGQRVLVSR